MPRKKIISKDKFKIELGQRIRVIRKAKGISIKQLEAMDESIDRSNLSRFEKGELLPTSYTLLKLATLLEEDISSFYNGKKKED
ncbi:MAG: helix-turn-helix transcriptional regulator [Cyclobacteriaceae bacterium]|nr:helix-turn-helix transcriptional regulator [Cyclobacteriaceae bacterium]